MFKSLRIKASYMLKVYKELGKELVRMAVDFEDWMENFMEEISSFEECGRDITVAKSNGFVMGVTGALPVVPMALATKMGDQYFVIVNDGFQTLPKKQRLGIIQHEVGHIVCDHLENPLAAILSNVYRSLGLNAVPKMEAEADQWAVDAGHGEGLYRGLRSIRDSLAQYGLGNQEMKLRLNKLRKYSFPVETTILNVTPKTTAVTLLRGVFECK